MYYYLCWKISQLVYVVSHNDAKGALFHYFLTELEKLVSAMCASIHSMHCSSFYEQQIG